jgi:hypothetical protein
LLLGAAPVHVRGDDLALGTQLSGTGYGDVAEQERAVVSGDIRAWNGGFSGDSALAAGGADAVCTLGSVCLLRDEIQQAVAGVWDGGDLAGVWGEICEYAALVFCGLFCRDGIFVCQGVVEEAAQEGGEMSGVWI